MLTNSLFAAKQHFAKKIVNRSAYPLVTGEIFRNLCHHKLDETPFDPKQVEEGDLIFANSTNLTLLFSVIDEIPNKFILISHLSPKTNFEKFRKYLDNPKLIAWFAKNSDGSHPKLHFLPNGIGRMNNALDSFGMSFDLLRTNIYFCPSSKKYSISNQCSLLNWSEKKYFLSLNFTMRYNRLDRQPVYDLFQKENYCIVFPFLPYDEYIQILLDSCFVLSPRGSGLDCYRTWEALGCGSFPIVLSSYLDKEFKELPVVIVNSWETVTREYLCKKICDFSKRQFNFEKLLSDYWIKKIVTIRNEYAPYAQKNYLFTASQNSYLGFKLEPFEIETDSDFSNTIQQWITKNNITNVVTYNQSAAIPLAKAIPTYGHVILVDDLSERQRNQFLSNVLHLFLAQKVVLYSRDEWDKHPINQLSFFE